MKAKHDLTAGPVRGHLLRMSLFILATMLVQTAYSLVDIYWVGRLGRDAVAAVALGSNLMMAVMAIGQILSVGSVALIAQAAGRKETAAVRQLFTQSFLLSALVGALCVLAFRALEDSYSRALAGDAQTEQLTREFLFWFVPSMGLQILLFVVIGALRAIGDVKTPSLAQLGTILLNMLLAPLLIFGWLGFPRLGVGGAALATLLSLAIGCVVLMVHIVRRGNLFDMKLEAWRPQLGQWLRFMRIGLPSGVEFGLMTLYFGFVMYVLQGFGTAPQAAFGIGQRILQAGMMPAMSVAFASAAIVGQNYGAGYGSRVRDCFKDALQINLAASALFWLAFHLLPETVMSIFSKDPDVIRYGAEFMRWISWNFFVMALVFAAFGVFSGIGHMVPSLIASATRITLVVAVVWPLSKTADFVPHWVWQASVCASLVQAGVSAWFLRAVLGKHLARLSNRTESAPKESITEPT